MSSPSSENRSWTFMGASVFARALFASALLGATELLLLPPDAWTGLEGIGARLVFIVSFWGNEILGALCGSLALEFLAALGTHPRLGRRKLLKVSFLAALFAAPYGFWLSRYTLSGPQVRDLSYQPLLVALLFAFFLSGAIALFRVSFFVSALRNKRALALALTLLAQAALHGVNRYFLPNEYAPLHQFLAGIALLVSLIGVSPFSEALARKQPAMKTALGLALLSALGYGASAVSLNASESMSWIVWGLSPSSRFITLRQGETGNGETGDETHSHGPPPGEKSRQGALSQGEKIEFPESQDAARRRAERAKQRQPHIVVFSIDNLQADRVGAFGYSKNPTTPNIDRLSKNGFLFKNAYSHYPGTRVFLSSMLTGRRLPEFSRHRMPRQFEAESLTRLLGTRGYHTLVKGVFELTAFRDFDPNRYGIHTNLERETAEQIRKSKSIPHVPLKKRYRRIAQHLAQAAKLEKPVFVWLHLLQPHRFRGGFSASKDFPFGSDLDSQYDSAIAATDAWIVPLEELMKKHLSDEREIIWVFMADHGAGMTRSKDKREVGKTLYNDQVHVPLIIVAPGYRTGESHVLVDSAVDTSATILDLAGVPVPGGFDGTSLVPLLEGSGDEAPFQDRLIPLSAGALRGAVHGNDKLILQSGSVSLFDLSEDPQEKKNLADRKRKLQKLLKKRANREHGRMKAAYEAGLDQRTP